MIQTNWKDILIGVLVAYVVIDVMMAYAMKRSSPSCLEKAMAAMSDQSGLVAVIIGVLVGVVVWYLASRSKECFVPAPSVIEETIEDEK